IARGDADEPRAEAFLVIGGRIEGQVREVMVLASLPNRLHARLFVEGLVAALLRSTVDDQVDSLHEIFEGARRLDARLLELRGHVRVRGVQRISLPNRELRLEIG